MKGISIPPQVPMFFLELYISHLKWLHWFCKLFTLLLIVLLSVFVSFDETYGPKLPKKYIYVSCREVKGNFTIRALLLLLLLLLLCLIPFLYLKVKIIGVKISKHKSCPEYKTHVNKPTKKMLTKMLSPYVQF